MSEHDSGTRPGGRCWRLAALGALGVLVLGGAASTAGAGADGAAAAGAATGGVAIGVIAAAETSLASVEKAKSVVDNAPPEIPARDGD